MTKLHTLVPTTIVGAFALAGGYALALRSNPVTESQTLSQEALSSTNSAADQRPLIKDPSADVVGAEVNAEIHIPRRLNPPRDTTVQIPGVPQACDRAPSLTLEVLVGTGKQTPLKKTITRTAQRVHVKLGESATSPEWLFIRNPVTPTRVDATLVNHHQKVILEYDDTALRNMGIATGWAEIVALSVNPNVITKSAGSNAERQVSNFSFATFQEKEGSDKTLWWSESACLPLAVTNKAATSQTSTIVAIEERIDATLLRDARVRYPDYQSIEAIDWLEKHHDEGHEAHH